MHKRSGIYELMQDLGDALSRQDTVYMLGGGNPAHITAMQALFRTAMEQLLETPGEFEKMVGDYDAPKGNVVFCQRLAQLLNTHFNWNISADNIAITNGSQATFSALFQILLKSHTDSHILLPIVPEYIGYKDIKVRDKNIFVANAPKINDTSDPWCFKYDIDFETLNITEKTRAMCLSRPTNPSGNLVSDAQLKRLSDLAKQHNIPLIVDGAYGLPFPNIVFNQANTLWNDNIILCLSLSKLGLPGVRTGIVIAKDEIIEQLSDYNAMHALAPGSFGPALMLQLLKQHDLIEACNTHVTPFYKKRCQQAVNMIKTHFKGLPVKIHEPEGALFLWLWCQNLPISSDELYQRLKAKNVIVLSGHHFFPGLENASTTNNSTNLIHQQQNQCLRLSYCAPLEILEAGLKIIAEQLREIYQI